MVSNCRLFPKKSGPLASPTRSTNRPPSRERHAKHARRRLQCRASRGLLKVTPSRTVGPDETIGVREDSKWNVPEPELGVVLFPSVTSHPFFYYDEIVGNDVSSCSIEGQNPLYLPQAKIYNRCCSIGPCVTSIETISDSHGLSISMIIIRDGEEVLSGETSTGEMVRTCEELADYYTCHNAVPELAVLLTDTSIISDDNFDLTENDEVHIKIEGIVILSNPVITV